MRRLLAVLALGLLVACGGGSSGDPVAPTPVVPSYASVTGNWAGTETIISAVRGGSSASNICQEAWSVTSQQAGDFQGTWQASGGTLVNCAQTGTLTGSVSTDGSLAVQLTVTLGATGCTAISGGPTFSGSVSGSTLTIERTDAVQCGTGSSAVQADRDITLKLTRD